MDGNMSEIVTPTNENGSVTGDVIVEEINQELTKMNDDSNVKISDEDECAKNVPISDEIMILQETDVISPVSAVVMDPVAVEYESITEEVYENSNVLSDSIIVDTGEENTVLIVDSSGQISNNNIEVCENVDLIETHTDSVENDDTMKVSESELLEEIVHHGDEHVIESVEYNDDEVVFHHDEVVEVDEDCEQIDETVEISKSIMEELPLQEVISNEIEERISERLQEEVSIPGTNSENVIEIVDDVIDENVDCVLEDKIDPIVENVHKVDENVDREINENSDVADANVYQSINIDGVVESKVSQPESIEIIDDENMEESTELVTETDTQPTGPKENTEKIMSYINVEQQISDIVRQDDGERENDAPKSISIVEAISRDFDETDDSEDADKAIETTPNQDVEQVVKMNVPDAEAGQVYIVEAVDNVIVLESGEVHEHIDDPIEITVIEHEHENELQLQEKTTKPAKKPRAHTARLPSHVLGRNIINPSDDKFRNGKVPPKPRLGVKIPYRNLTSQIVSKDEIEKEILDRQKQKYDQVDSKPGESFFAKKLTQRLAKRIAPPKDAMKEAKTTGIVVGKSTAENIDHSDLIAILEGDGEENECKKQVESEVKMTEMDSNEDIKLLEKQIALKQLKELPRGRGRARRPYNSQPRVLVNSEKQKLVKVPEPTQLDPKIKSVEISTNAPKNAESKTNLKPEKIKDNKIVDATTKTGAQPKTDTQPQTDAQSKTDAVSKPDTQPKAEAQHKTGAQPKTKAVAAPPIEKAFVNVDPKPKPDSKSPETKLKPSDVQKIKPVKIEVDPLAIDSKDEYPARKLSTNMPVKTYARKRKLSDDLSPADKKLLINFVKIKDEMKDIPPQGYVTKSSRVIKRKVIWDPDEPSTAKAASLKSPKHAGDLPKVEKVVSRSAEKKPVKVVVKVEAKSEQKPMNKKRLTEVDRLLMDEGAVNLLYAFKNTEDGPKKKKATVISLDRAQRELMNKTNEIKKELRSSSDKVSPKSLRKKESPIAMSMKKSVTPALVTRKKSKDSNRSSLHSPPASPGLIYLHHAEASRIIRRHSSSSYSSEDGDGDKKEEKLEDVKHPHSETDKVAKRKSAVSSLDVAKPKKVKKNVDKEKLTIVTDKTKDSPDNSTNFSKLVEIEGKNLEKYNQYKTFSVKIMDHLVQIVLLPSINNQVYLTPEILQELCAILKEIEQDKKCNVVVVNSSAMSFCNGINYKSLLHEKEQARKTFSKKLATLVSHFLKTLATFPKILVAGVHGDTTGLGVTMLPLFDMVIASDTATFSVQNARLGCPAEGGSLLSLPHLMHNVLVSELLYSSRKLIAAEALKLGMVTRILWPDKFQQELVAIVKMISNHSPQFMQLTKKQLRKQMLLNVESMLTQEIATLVEHWTGTECQKNFGVYG